MIALPWAKIVDIPKWYISIYAYLAKIKFNKGFVFTAKVPYQFARAHVLHAPHHLVTFAIDICSRKLIIVPIFTSLLDQSFPKSEDPQPTRTIKFRVYHPEKLDIII